MVSGQELGHRRDSEMEIMERKGKEVGRWLTVNHERIVEKVRRIFCCSAQDGKRRRP